MNRVRRIIQVDYARRMGLDGTDVCVAVLDSGCCEHLDFGDRIVYFKDFIHPDRTKSYDDNGHGSHVCGIIAGSGKASRGLYSGIAPGSRLVVLKVLDENGNGNFQPFIKALEWLHENYRQYHIRILNISVAVTPHSDEDEAKRLLSLVEQLWDDGLVVIAAAGNYGPKQGTIAIPGINRKIITVGCLDRSGGCLLSGRGPTAECVMKPEIVAPGSRVISCTTGKNGYSMKSGTSMAAPIVTGVVALMLQKNPRMTNKQIKETFRSTAQTLNRSREQQGWGMIQVRRIFSQSR